MPQYAVSVSLAGESERLGRNVYNAFDATNGEFAVVYEWILRWNKKIGKFFTSEENSKIDSCKKQVSNSLLRSFPDIRCYSHRFQDIVTQMPTH